MQYFFVSIFIFILGLISIFQSMFFVSEKKTAIIERFGKFYKLGYPGLNFKVPFIDSVIGELSLQGLYHNVLLETKTNDNVFVNIHCSIQYKVLEEKAFEAYYALDNPVTQLESYVFDAIRAFAPKLTLDKLFEEKDTIANEVNQALNKDMHNFGLFITKTLITHIDPDDKVKHAMNEINAAERERIAAAHRAEAEKLVVIKAAEAQKESRILQGEGVAGQRKAIIHGLRDSLNELQSTTDSNSSITEQEAINLLLVNQYYDTLKDIGSHSKSNVVFLNHNPNSAPEFKKDKSASISDLLETLISADIIKTDIKKN